MLPKSKTPTTIRVPIQAKSLKKFPNQQDPFPETRQSKAKKKKTSKKGGTVCIQPLPRAGWGFFFFASCQ
jgi:hypothetical protein